MDTMALKFSCVVITLIVVTFANAVFVVRPRNYTEVVIGYSTYLNCSHMSKGIPLDISWYHYKVGASNDQSTEVYAKGELHPPYANRLRVEKTSNVSTNLIFPSAKYIDAGRYDCVEGGSKATASAQLVLLESLPVCDTSIVGAIVRSKCGVEPDPFVISCRVSYRGNISPVLEWTKLDSNESLTKYKKCKVDGNVTTCRLTLAADNVTNGVSYACHGHTLNSGDGAYSCLTEKLKVINVFDNYSPVKRKLNEVVSCLEASSPLCTYKWSRIDIETSKVVSLNMTLTLTEPGMYRCETECRISYNICSVVPVVAHVDIISDPNTDSTKTLAFLLLPIVIVCVMIVVIAGCCTYCKSATENKPQRTSSIKSVSEVSEAEKEYDELDAFEDGIPDSTVTSFLDMRTDQVRNSTDITTKN